MFAFGGFQASSFRECGASGFTASRVSEDGEQRASEGGAREQKRRAERKRRKER